MRLLRALVDAHQGGDAKTVRSILDSTDASSDSNPGSDDGWEDD